jgi:hypothetical protein
MTSAIKLMLYEHEKGPIHSAVRVKTDMRHMLIVAYEPIYFAAFVASTDRAIGQSSVRAMFAHLETTYSIVCAPEVAKEMAKLQSPFNPAEPIEKYWATIKQVAPFATKHRTAPHNATVIEEILSLFEGGGHFRDEVEEWRLKPEAAHILTDFITAITAMPLTVAKAGYHGANVASITVAASATASSAPVTPPPKATASKTTTILHADNPGKLLTVCYCSVHGVQNSSVAAPRTASTTALTKPQTIAGSMAPLYSIVAAETRYRPCNELLTSRL